MPNREERINNLRNANEKAHEIVVESLKQALYKLLAKKDLNAITVTELVKTAGVSRGVFYKYFYMVSDVFLDDIKVISALVNATMSSDLYMNWLNIFNAAYQHREKIRLLFKANMGMEMLNQLNAIARSYNGDTNEMIMWHGIIFNAIVSWADDGFSMSAEEYARVYERLTSSIFRNQL